MSCRPKSVFDVGALQPVGQGRVGDAEVLGDLSEWCFVFSSDRHDVVAELLWIGSRHCCHPSVGINPTS
jgi:hypothetical protein